MNGRPIPASTWPTITVQKPPTFTNSLIDTPIIPRVEPTIIPALIPFESMTYAAGNVNNGCMSINSSPHRLVTMGV